MPRAPRDTSRDTPPASSSSSADSSPTDGYQFMVDHTRYFLGLLDPDGTVKDANRSLLELCGLARDAVIGQPVWALPVWSPEGRTRLQEAVSRVARGEPVSYETEARSASDRQLTVALSLRPLDDDRGSVGCLLAEGYDVTARQQAELALERQRVFLQAVLDNISDGIAACDAEGVLSVFNPATRALHNLPEFSLPASEWAERYDLYKPDGVTRLGVEEVPLYRALHGEVVEGAEMVIAPEGSEPRRVLVSGRALTGKDGEPLGAVVAMRDITATRAAESALRDSEAQHRAVIDSLSEGILQQDRDGHIVMCNAAAERILGVTKKQLLEQDSLDPRWHLVNEDGSPFPGETHPALVALRSGEPQERVVMGVHKPNGRLTWILVNCQPLWRLGEAEAYAVVSSFTDITHLKHTEAQLRHASLHDALTGLPVRTLFRERLAGALRHAEGDPNFCFAVLYIDLDGFKAVNDTLGHSIGDNLLVTVARQLERCVRGGDTVARLGGDEFAVLLEHLTHPQDATQLAERVLRDLAISLNIAGKEVSVGASIGIALSDRQRRARDLLDAADAAMYRAKAAGRGRYEVYAGDTPD